jgi:uncharacterized Fe-S cluster-containing radical SAM superfamily enzyme
MAQEYLALYCLSHDKYLVEKTTDPTKSFQRHVDGIGGPYTQKYMPYVILDIIPINSKELICIYNNMVKLIYLLIYNLFI